jgi:hypothetical protein
VPSEVPEEVCGSADLATTGTAAGRVCPDEPSVAGPPAYGFGPEPEPLVCGKVGGVWRGKVGGGWWGEVDGGVWWRKVGGVLCGSVVGLWTGKVVEVGGAK